jgi:hypothetical protein
VAAQGRRPRPRSFLAALDLAALGAFAPLPTTGMLLVHCEQRFTEEERAGKGGSLLRPAEDRVEVGVCAAETAQTPTSTRS